MKAKITERLIAVIFLAGLLAVWTASEVRYAHEISPAAMSTAQDYLRRFGDPRAIYVVSKSGTNYYEFIGAKASSLTLAMPSSPPAYVFDTNGNFIAWCRDPGDDHRHRETWPRQGTNRLDMNSVRQQLADKNAGKM